MVTTPSEQPHVTHLAAASSFASPALYALGIYALIRAVMFALVLRQLLALRQLLEPSRVCAECEVPAHERAILGPINEWQRLGFEHAAWCTAPAISNRGNATVDGSGQTIDRTGLG